MLPASPVDRHARNARRARRARPRVRVALVLVLVPALAVPAMLSACSLDWSVRPDLADGAPAESGGSDADAGDARISADAADTSVPTDAPVSPDAAACAALASEVAQKRKKARECQSAVTGQCTTTVDDECGCRVIVTFAGAPNTNAYTAAVATLVAQCKPDCSAPCPQVPLMMAWACLAPTGEFLCTQ